MKTIGLIGGMSWESTIPYYRIINEEIKNELKGLHSAKILLYSVDFEEIEYYQSHNQWNKSVEVLSDVAKRLESAGADFIVICTNTMHKIYHEIQASIKIPILHIADATSNAIKKEGLHKVLLLGTKYTMQEDFYKQRVKEQGIDIIVPDESDVTLINDIIFKELVLGDIKESSKEMYLKIINKYMNQGIEGVILGCTEIGLLIKQEDLDMKVFDTTEMHAKEAAKYALDKGFR